MGSEHLADGLPTVDDVRPATAVSWLGSAGQVAEAARRFAREIADTVRAVDPGIDCLGVDRFHLAALDALRARRPAPAGCGRRLRAGPRHASCRSSCPMCARPCAMSRPAWHGSKPRSSPAAARRRYWCAPVAGADGQGRPVHQHPAVPVGAADLPVFPGVQPSRGPGGGTAGAGHRRRRLRRLLRRPVADLPVRRRQPFGRPASAVPAGRGAARPQRRAAGTRTAICRPRATGLALPEEYLPGATG